MRTHFPPDVSCLQYFISHRYALFWRFRAKLIYDAGSKRTVQRRRQH
jgi:hypothetical protein